MGADFSKIVDDVQHCNCYGGAAPEDTVNEERVEQSSSQLAEFAVAASQFSPPQELREQAAPGKTLSQQVLEETSAVQQASSEPAVASDSARVEKSRSSEEVKRKKSQEILSQRSANRIDGIRRALSGQVAAMAGKVMPKRESSAKFSKKESSGKLSVQSSASAAAAAEQPRDVIMGPIDTDMIFADPDSAGQAIYPRVFMGLAGDSVVLELDNKDLRAFILKHSGVSEDDLDTEILKAASCREDFLIDGANFTKLMQEHPVAEADALNIFLGMSSDGETITAEDCRTALLRLLEQLPDVKGRNEEIFDTVMADAGLAVPMDQWMSFATKTARIARLMPLAESADGGSRKQLGAKVGQQPSSTRRSVARVGGA